MAATYPTFNIELHNKIIEQIENHPETWDQNDWHCGTKHCYAGWAQILSGKEANVDTVRQDARAALGLVPDEESMAFNAFKTLEGLKRLPKTIAKIRSLP